MASNRNMFCMGDSGSEYGESDVNFSDTIEDDESEAGDVDLLDEDNNPSTSAHFHCKQCGKQCVLFV